MGEENEAKATAAEVDDTKKAKKPKADRLEKKSYAQRTSPICRTASFHGSSSTSARSTNPSTARSLARAPEIHLYLAQQLTGILHGARRSLTDLELAKEMVFDSKTGMTPREQLDAVYARVRELTPIAAEDFRQTRHLLDDAASTSSTPTSSRQPSTESSWII